MLPRRRFHAEVQLSIIGLGGVTLGGLDPPAVERLVADTLARGVNFYDVSPTYAAGEAETGLGRTLAPYRQGVFLAGKTLERTAAGARRELEASLRRLRTDHFDLFQLHAVNRREDVDAVFASGGALEALLRAREDGLVRFLGFSSHSVPVSLALLDRFRFDAMLFPVNFICYGQGNFGPQVLERARGLGVAVIGLKALALGRLARNQVRTHPNCWYLPIEEPSLARQALRFALSEDVVSLLPPGDEQLFRRTLEAALGFVPLADEERRRLLDGTRGMKPLMWTRTGPFR